MKRATVERLGALDDHWRRIDEIQRAKENACTTRPKNSVTVAEFAQKYRIGSRAAADRLKQMIRDGHMKRVRCLAETNNGTRSIFAYLVV